MRNQSNGSGQEHEHAVPSRREALIRGAAIFATPFLSGMNSSAKPREALATEWPNYAGDKASSKYSPLDQIGKDNFKRLSVAWTWRSAEEEIAKANHLKTWIWESTPLMVDGVLYVSTSLSQVAAIDAETGKTRWVYDPETWKNGTPSNNGFVHRGVAYWADGNDRRILFGTGDGYLICLKAQTGKPIFTFGQEGRIDLTQGLDRPVDRHLYGVSSPPIICRDIVVMGSKVNDVPLVPEMPPGDVRGFDVRTGKQQWIFHAIPRQGEFGNETWKGDSWKTTGATNVWTMMSADEALGYVYLPFSTPSDDHYGVHRPGGGLFGESLVCLEARTGKRVWHFQMVHHGLWDYDPPCAPNLIDIRVDGQPVKAVAQMSKQGFCYVFDRVTGKPIWPIEEKPVPQSTIPGERTAATQPFPTKPLPFDRQGVTKDDVTDFTPELHRQALAILEKYNYGPLFRPPSLEKPTIEMPGIAGGASWSGAACDPETGICYVSSVTLPYAATLTKSSVPNVEYYGNMTPVETMEGVPLWKPPYGRITAIDLNTGAHRWMAPAGDLAQSNPVLQRLGLRSLGHPARGHLLLTKTLLIVGQEGSTQREGIAEMVPKFQIHDPKLCAYDKTTGKLVGEIALARNATAAPMTYMLKGKQYILVATGGANLPAELIALRLS
ncbi:MAG: pyrroloquinoline quinone-dependent dehydrogenase [Bryobacteraceae bacterium]